MRPVEGEGKMYVSKLHAVCVRERALEDYSCHLMSEQAESSFAVIDFKLINDLPQ